MKCKIRKNNIRNIEYDGWVVSGGTYIPNFSSKNYEISASFSIRAYYLCRKIAPESLIFRVLPEKYVENLKNRILS